jgi:hypothetical protein
MEAFAGDARWQEQYYDSLQTNRMYSAEHAALKGKQQFASHDDIHQFIEKKFYGNPKLTEKYGDAANHPVGLKISKTKGKYLGHADVNDIEFHGRDVLDYGKYVVCHELAHIIHQRLTDVQHTFKGTHVTIHGGGQYHGHKFAAVYLNVVDAMMGKRYKDMLQKSFDKHRINYTVPRELNQRVRPT